MDPWDQTERFLAAVAAGDAGAASTCCTADGWMAGEGSVERLVRMAVDRGLTVSFDSGNRDGERATATIVVDNPARPGRARPSTLLLVDEGGEFLIDGVALGPIHEAAFLAGHLDARPAPTPADPQELLSRISPQNTVGRRFRMRLELLTEAGGSWSIDEATALESVGRAMLRVRSVTAEGDASEAFVYLDLDAGDVLSEDTYRSWSSYLAAPAEPEPEDTTSFIPPTES